MKTQKISISLLLANLVFKVGPTILIIGFILDLASQNLAQFGTNFFTQFIIFTIGVCISFAMYSYQIRFTTTFLILFLLAYFVYKLINNVFVGEFDLFFAVIRFALYACLFLLSWIVGYGFARFGRFAIPFAIIIFSLAGFIFIRSTDQLTSVYIISYFSPILLYCSYIIYINEILRKLQTVNKKIVFSLVNRTFLFIFILLIPFTALFVFLSVIEQRVQDHLRQKQNENLSLIEKDANGRFDIQNFIKLLPELQRNEETLFCAYIKNFIEHKDKLVPMPVHFRRFILSQYDPGSETFQIDAAPPIESDLFSPNPAQIPMYLSERDTNIYRISKGYKFRRPVEIIVFLKNLSGKSFVAPNIAYYCQRIPENPETEFRHSMFHLAYRCSSMVSDLNLSYFVYNIKDPFLVQFQQQRESLLHQIEDYSGVDSSFLAYYTKPMECDTMVQQLANRLTGSATKPMEKLNRIRSYFESTDGNGDRIFSYSLAPGKPSDPDQSLLNYFLFENHKGYCSYYAFATLFLLRAAGIPCRIVVGFNTFDRSNRNPGWYWFYADQAHAWIEVFFPKYGWLDFDTTPSAEGEEPPRPDPTPPLIIERSTLAVFGRIKRVHPTSREVEIQPRQLSFKDSPLPCPTNVSLVLKTDSDSVNSFAGRIPLLKLREDDIVLAASHKGEIDQIQPPTTNRLLPQWYNALPKPIPVREFILMPKIGIKDKQTPEKPILGEKFGQSAMIILIGFIVIIGLFPGACYLYFYTKAKSKSKPANRAYFIYKFSSYLLNMYGYRRVGQTALEFARNVIDPKFNLAYEKFTQIFLKSKYSKSDLTADEVAFFDSFPKTFNKKIIRSHPKWKTALNFVNIVRAVRFFYKFKG
ncbi:hypothetical protein JXJ21_10525 [candidate division KSB1 bacterium]|nr:hypothetical protein [candidate division KSB1 bacterium]